MSNEIRRCINCLISETFPGVKFGDDEVCNLCKKFDPEKEKQIVEANRKKIDTLINEKKGINRYDV
ncbi:MAG: hypothetical protein HQK78_17895, partial [Desulfobacterales bacterium]|nr:hypothetical protein [Desulfobacterales bacterium]